MPTSVFIRRRRSPSSSASVSLIMNSSILWPVLSAAVSHRGCFPRPDQVSKGSSGFRYWDRRANASVVHVASRLLTRMCLTLTPAVQDAFPVRAFLRPNVPIGPVDLLVQFHLIYRHPVRLIFLFIPASVPTSAFMSIVHVDSATYCIGALSSISSVRLGWCNKIKSHNFTKFVHQICVNSIKPSIQKIFAEKSICRSCL